MVSGLEANLREELPSLLVGLKDPQALDKDRVGGKFSSQARLAQLGFWIPNAFCITANVLTDLLLQTDSRNEPPFPDSPASCDLRSSGLDSSKIDDVLGPEMPDSLTREILNRAESMRWPLAVRSSAVVEDGNLRSYAGMFESILGVHTQQELIDAIRCCWASASSPRASFYAQEMGEKRALSKMAVICQELVNAKCGGVMFTEDPIDGSPILSIEASWGLPSLVVSGEITPDRVDVFRDGRILKTVIGSKQRVSICSNGIVETRCASRLEEETLCLSPDEIQLLVSSGLQIERVFGNPQDIEWAFEARNLFILQSRSITTLKRG